MNRNKTLAIAGRPSIQIVGCPDCCAPAEVTDWFTLPSTDGPVEHVVVICAAGHQYRMPAEGL